MGIKWILMSVLLFVSVNTYAQHANVQRQFEEELKAKNAHVSTIQCKFVQERQVLVLAQEVKKSGTFYFRQPNDILLAFDDGEYIKMTRELFEIKTGSRVSRTKVASNPMLKNLNTILSACVRGNFSEIKGFTVKVEQISQEWMVTLIPKRGKALSKISRIIIHFESDNMSINRLKMEEKSGDYTMYTFFQKQFNGEVNNQLFH